MKPTTSIHFCVLASVSLLMLLGAPAASAQADRTDDAPLEVRSEHLSVDASGRRADFDGEVVVRKGALYLRCERLTAHYDEDGQATRIVAVGGVKLSHGALFATAKKADYTRATKVVSLTGSPKVWRGPSTLVGEAIRIHLDSEKVEVDKPRGSVQLPPLPRSEESQP